MRMESEPREKATSTKKNWAGATAYLTFLPAILFLVLRSYRNNSFVRFHSVQCLLCWLVGVVLALLLRLSNLLLSFIPVAGPLLSLLLIVIAILAPVLTWVVVLVKAFQGERFALPVIGDIAEQYSVAT